METVKFKPLRDARFMLQNIHIRHVRYMYTCQQVLRPQVQVQVQVLRPQLQVQVLQTCTRVQVQVPSTHLWKNCKYKCKKLLFYNNV